MLWPKAGDYVENAAWPSAQAVRSKLASLGFAWFGFV
jgi:hypothetical protein